MEIKRIGSQPSVKGPSEWFTGSLRRNRGFSEPWVLSARLAGSNQTFMTQPRLDQSFQPHVARFHPAFHA